MKYFNWKKISYRSNKSNVEWCAMRWTGCSFLWKSNGLQNSTRSASIPDVLQWKIYRLHGVSAWVTICWLKKFQKRKRYLWPLRVTNKYFNWCICKLPFLCLCKYVIHIVIPTFLLVILDKFFTFWEEKSIGIVRDEFSEKYFCFFLGFSEIVQETDQSKAKILPNLPFTLNESYYMFLLENLMSK